MRLKLHTHMHKPRKRLWHYVPVRKHSVLSKLCLVMWRNLFKCQYLVSGRGMTAPRAGTRAGAAPGDTEGSPKGILMATCRKHYKTCTHTMWFRCQQAEGTEFPLRLCYRQYGQAKVHNSLWPRNSQWPHMNITEPLHSTQRSKASPPQQGY